jgi:O-antigen/teichoic acid export membrane protein
MPGSGWGRPVSGRTISLTGSNGDVSVPVPGSACPRESNPIGIRSLRRFSVRTPLTTSAFYLVCNAGLGSILGSAFWLVAARLYAPSAIGLASAAVGVLLLLATLCDLGLDYAQMRFASANPDQAGEIANLSFTLAGMVSLAAGLIFLAGIGMWSRQFLRFNDVPAVFVVFALAAPAYTIGSLLDATLIAQGRSKFVILKNGLANALRFPLAITLIAFGSAGLFIAMSGAVSLVALLSVPALRWVLPRYRYTPTVDLAMLRRLVPYGIKNHIVNIVSSLPSLLLPMIVLNALGSATSGYFAIAWLLVQPITMVQASVSSALLSEGSRVEHRYMGEIRRALALTLPLVCGTALLGNILAGPLLGLFGGVYAAQSAVLLRWLLASTVPGTMNSLFQSRCRIERRSAPIAWLAIGSAGITLTSLFLLLPHWRLAGVGVAVAAGQAVPAIWTSTRVLRRERSEGGI